MSRLVWIGVFWSLGLNFVQMGLRAGGPDGWAMVVVALVFVALAALPVSARYEAGEPWRPFPRFTGGRAYVVTVLAAIAAGATAAVPAFYAIAA